MSEVSSKGANQAKVELLLMPIYGHPEKFYILKLVDKS
jgi:hypothetical protein